MSPTSPEYNTQRPHRYLAHRSTPAAACPARPKATPGDRSSDTHDRVRDDRVSKTGSVTLRHNGRLHHIGVGRTYAGTYVRLLAQDLEIRIVDTATGELLRELVLDPNPRLPAHRKATRTNQQNQQRTYVSVGPSSGMS